MHITNKLSRYSDFIVDKDFLDAINEGKLVATDNFLGRLKSMTNNKIASALHDAFSQNQLIDKNLNYNWIDTTDQDAMISFTSDRNAERFANDPSQIYASKRQVYSVGKLARAILPELGYKIANDKEIEDFLNLYKASKVDSSKVFKIVEGPIIREYYKEKSYAADTGTLAKSCMRYDECQGYFKIYSRNTDVCRMLVYLDEDQKVLGRALIWKLWKTDLYSDIDKPYEANIEYFMDRVYSTNESDVLKFTDYAKQNGWLVKNKMSASNVESLQFIHNGNLVFGQIWVKLSRLHFDEYPYVDTLKFSDGDSLISNVGFYVDMDSPDHDLGFVLNNTDGRATYCPKCNGTGKDKDQKDRCSKCKGKKEIKCQACGGTSLKVCEPCRGLGKEECSKCNGNGNVPCPNCKADEVITCSTCAGEGDVKCEICQGKGDLGNCPECQEGEKICPHCKNEPLSCNNCEGRGITEDELGDQISCVACNGQGKSKEGTFSAEGCRCPECSIDLRGGRRWVNEGSFDCNNCEGTGHIDCPGCNEYHEKVGHHECQDCKGVGKVKCKSCRNGFIKCDKCNGTKYTGVCKICKGEGNVGPCDCNNGNRPCEDCNSTGIRGKIKEGDYKCSDCAGLLDDFIAKKYPSKRIN